MPKIEKREVEFEGEIRRVEVLVEHDPLSPWKKEEELAHVGKSARRLDGPERVTGAAVYTSDVRVPGMLHGKILRCPHPHARIRHIDTRGAESLNGVIAVMTRATTPPIRMENGQELFEGELRYAGEEVAAVIAIDDQLARDARDLIQVEYEILPFVTDPQKALEPGTPAVRPGGNLIFGPENVYRRGDAEKGLAGADYVVRAEYRTQVAMHNCLETHGSVAQWEGGRLTVWDSTQGIFSTRQSLAEALGIPQHRIRVITRFMGGGFGSKLYLWKYTVLAALGARAAGKPVRFVLDRDEENLATGNRPAATMECAAGATRDGTLTALWARVTSAIGAYGSGSFPVAGPFRRLYRCPHVYTEERTVLTNTGAACAFRGPGYTEGAFALECLIDELAEKIGMDPLELRLRNHADVDQLVGSPYSSNHLREACRAGAEKIGWSKRRATPPKSEGRFRRGMGMACHIWGGSGSPPSYALVVINSQAAASVITGAQDIGTGAQTSYAQIAAEELGFKLRDVSVELGDSGHGLYAMTSGGSMTLASIGPAVRTAAFHAKKELLEIASSKIGVRPDELEIKNGMIVRRSGRGKRVSVADALRGLEDYLIIGKGGRAPNPGKRAISTFGAQFAEVEVDTMTGRVRLLRLTGAHDIGRVINPMAVASQLEGGVIQGAGFALTEQRIIDNATGMMLNSNLEDYRVFTALDIPDMNVHPIDIPDMHSNNLGAKGIGEPPIIPVAPVVANAVYNATGVRVRRLPITPAVVLESLSSP